MAERKRTTAPLDLPQLLAGLEAGVRHVEQTPSRDARRVMLGLLLRDLEKAALDIDQMAAFLDEYRRKHRGLQADAQRIKRRDGTPIAPDDDSSVRGIPPKLKPEAQPLWELGISPGLANHLADAGITTREQLASLSFAQLVALPRIGRSSAFKILELVRRLKAREEKPRAS